MSEEEDLKYLQTEYEENIITELIKEVESLQNQLQQKENIRKEAIEYVKSKEFAENFPYVMNECQVRSFLLNILNKGE